MPPKKSTAAAPKKAAAAAPAHASYLDMVKVAIVNLKERNGSSRQAIQKYIKANNTLGDVTDVMFKSHVNRAIVSGEKAGDFTRPKGASGTVKLAKKESAKKAEPKTEKKPAAPKAKKAAAPKAKAATTTKKAPVAKKVAAKPTAAKKTAAKPKANASKPRKAAAPPAVEKEISRVLGKTKSGRVTKTTAPAEPKTAKKAAAPKKKAATKKSTPKKATPKKAAA
ncbi:hypothetical protein K505DRAFT_363895 [Melanomma pulvis-pyrius CBS 109.77]|uniref:Histone H1 n=1 Tax=Melanomma pulvis-pyrius CBS 109.77 TaxID=1314802 RepID=A0A6A6X5G9_9PLEO|nr:hypothetical protein K505DRAFT_363895 [Melanomma pulvis-pyrius CBS 109.77]